MFQSDTTSEDAFPRLFLPYIIDRSGSYGRGVSFGPRVSMADGLSRPRVVVEFSSPNTPSSFEGKHLRSTIVGAFIANLHEWMGWDVVRLNYLGDWGKPIGLLGVGWERFGSEDAYKLEPLGHLMQIYHHIHKLFAPEHTAWQKARDNTLHGKIAENEKDQTQIESEGLYAERNEFFKRMENGEAKAIDLWKRVREESVKRYVQLYAQLGITFDDYSGESQISHEAMMQVEKLLKSKGLCAESGGSLIVDLKKYKLDVGIIRDRTGSRTYLLRDIAAVLERSKKYSFDKMLYVVAGHNVHFGRVTKVLELLDMKELADKLQHVQLSEKSALVDKLGPENATLEGILFRCHQATFKSLQSSQNKAAALENTEQVTATVGVSALIAQELSTKRLHEHIFDLSSMASVEPATGLSLRWLHAKLLNTIANCPKEADITGKDWAKLEDDEINLLRLLIQWPDIVQSAYRSLEPSGVVAYLRSISCDLISCFDKLGNPGNLSPAHASLFRASHIVLESALQLTGILPTHS